MRWAPDVVIHEVVELAGALAAARTGARHAVHGFGLMLPGLRELLAPEFGRLCEQWQVPDLAEGHYDATYLDICPPSLQPQGNQIWQRVQPLRPAVGETVAGERLPDAFTVLPHADTVYLTLGTIFHQFWNAAACQRVGAALTVPPEALSGEAVTASVRQLIAEPAFTVAAQGVQAEIYAMPTAADALAAAGW